MNAAKPLDDAAEDWPDLRIDRAEWSDALDVEPLVRRAAIAALNVAGIAPDQVLISFLFADDAALAELNGRFRDKETATNVLSWPSVSFETPASAEDLRPAPFFLGDVAFAYETIKNEAKAAGKPLEEHLAHLIVHGVLHLLGHDHQDEGEAAPMEAREVAALDSLGYGSPYGETGETAPQDWE